MQTHTTRRIQAGSCALLAAATLALAGCHHDQAASSGPGGGPSPQVEQQIQQNAAANAAAARNAPPMGTGPQSSGAAQGVTGANHP